MGSIIEVSNLVKNFGDVTALDGLNFSVPEGTVLGLLGPNGAGKTTAVSILTTLLKADQGQITVAGKDVVKDAHEVRKLIGLSGQSTAVDEILTGHENLEMIGRLYRIGRKQSKKRAAELLERFSLTEAGNRSVKTYSGGMRRRLDLAGALVAEPPVLILDEPTTGLDPRSRLELWGAIKELVASGTTVLLTTQYLEEADRLANNIVVIDNGISIAEGTPNQLKTQVGGERIELTVEKSEDIRTAQQIIESFSTGTIETSESDNQLLAPVSGGSVTLVEIVQKLNEKSIAISDVGLRRPTLDDVFLTLTDAATGRKESISGNKNEGLHS